MSSIDQYKHQLLDLITCPSDHDFVYQSNTRQIAIYKLEENIPVDETAFDGKKGDILVGGGCGEAQSLRIHTKKAKAFFIEDDFDFQNYDELFKCFWSPRFSYILGTGFIKLGWTPQEELDLWLSELVITRLVKKKLI